MSEPTDGNTGGRAASGSSYTFQTPVSPSGARLHLYDPRRKTIHVFPLCLFPPGTERQRLSLFAFSPIFLFLFFLLFASSLPRFPLLKNYNNNRGKGGGRGIDIKHGSQKRVAKSLP